MNLREYADKNRMSYITAWRRFKRGEIPGAKQTTYGIFIDEVDNVTISPSLGSAEDKKLVFPVSTELFETVAASRYNKSSIVTPLNDLRNIDEGFVPYERSDNKITITDTIRLTQKAYYNFSVVRNTIDVMTEFSTSPIYFRGGSKTVRDFFKVYFSKINIDSFQDTFFREYYRSGNVFIYPMEGVLKDEDIKSWKTVFGEAGEKYRIPFRYVILNPADIQVYDTSNFSSSKYVKVLNSYEISLLQNPRTEEDKKIYEGLSPDIKKLLSSKKNGSVEIPLDLNRAYAVFYKKQDYEPFATPLIYPILRDLNLKEEMKRMDAAILRTMQQVVLLITMGSELKDGTVNVNQKTIEAMRTLFSNESIGRVLVSDYTTKAEWVIPNISDILDPKKYEVIERDIQIGLNNIIMGEGEKFANQSLKIQIFIERLKQAREAFLKYFLIPEIKRISNILGFKNYPQPIFDDINLKDQVQFARIYTRLAELGIITADEVITAIETGRLPDSEESVESQNKYKSLKKSGLYEPLLNKQQENGRPEGSGTPQSTKDVKPIGTSKAEQKFSVTRIKENFELSEKLRKEIKSYILEKHSLKKLNSQQEEIVDNVLELIIANEKSENWLKEYKKYVDTPIDKNIENVNNVRNISNEHKVDFLVAGILYNSLV